MSLHRLIYRSESRLPASASDRLCEMATWAAHANARRNVTGAMMLAHGHFVQVLEGDAETLETLFETICQDERHARVQLLEFLPVSERLFPDWGMAHLCARPDADTDTAPAIPLIQANSAEVQAILRQMVEDVVEGHRLLPLLDGIPRPDAVREARAA